MSRGRGWITEGAVVALCLLLGSGVSTVRAQPEDGPAVESLLPVDSVVYIGWEGHEPHREAWEQTAAYEALYQSGLMDAVKKFAAGVIRGAADGQGVENMQILGRTFEHVAQQGASLAVAVPAEAQPPMAWGLLVMPDAADLEAELGQFIRRSAERMQFETRQINGREVTRAALPDQPHLELAWWTEGSHLVLALGRQPAEKAISVAEGQSANITENPLWEQYAAPEADYEVSLVGWLDFARLREQFGAMPVPMGEGDSRRVVALDEILQALGLETLGPLAGRSGYRGRALWSEVTLEAPAPRKGLLSLADQQPITLEDLPPLPEGIHGVAVWSTDWPQTYEVVTQAVRDVAALAGPDEEGQGELADLSRKLPFDPKQDVLNHLGPVTTVYGDPYHGGFGLGLGLIVKVDNPEELRAGLNQAVDALAQRAREKGESEIKIRRRQKHGREIVTVEIGGGFLNPTYAVDDNWLIVGLYPQTVEAFLLRVDGAIDAWTPSESFQEGLEQLPEEFVSLSTIDAKESYRAVLSWAPMLAAFLQAGLRQSQEDGFDLDFSVAELPPTELVTEPLFPNITVGTVDERGIHWTTRESAPTLPVLTGGGQSLATAGVMAALLLPAVQQAREAARRTQCQNNVRQITLAFHNYHETHGHFPPAVVMGPDGQTPHSWRVAILPYLDRQDLYDKYRMDEPWDSEHNKKILEQMPPVFRCPSDPSSDSSSSYYVLTGPGTVFDGEEGTSFRDITDGTSNTILAVEARRDIPWTRPEDITYEPNAPLPKLDSFHAGGFHAALCDGAVRFLSENIDPQTLRLLITKADGERVGAGKFGAP